MRRLRYAGATRAVGWFPRFLALPLLFALTGCAEAPDKDGSDPAILRNPTVTLAGTTRFDPARFAGEWRTLRCLGTCAPLVRFVQATDGVTLRQVGDVETAFRASGPGVLRKIGGGQTLVVMWVDEGFRTAAIGDANGRWAAVIERGDPRSDRTQAAVQVLEFNGWDVAKIKKVGT